MVKGVANIIFGLLYSFLGILILMKHWFLVELSKAAALSLGVLFIVYGIFRIYRAVKSIRNQNYN